MRNKKNYILLIALVTFLFVMQSVMLWGQDGSGSMQMEGMQMEGMQMEGMQMEGMTSQKKHDHVKHKKKEPVLLPGAKGKVSIGNRKGDPENGSRIFRKYCVYCHGKKGLGDGGVVIGLEASPPKYMREKGILYMIDQKIFDIITFGVKTNYQLEMPPWGPILSENERLDVIAYIKELAKNMYREIEGKEPPEEPMMASAR